MSIKFYFSAISLKVSLVWRIVSMLLMIAGSQYVCAYTDSIKTSVIKSPLIIKGDHFYPPYEFINDKGEPDGFNVELMRALAKELNLDYRLELDAWSNVRKQLEAGEIDVITGMMVSKERARKVRFGVPHSMMTHGIFSNRKKVFNSLEDLRGKEIIVQDGDRMHDYLLETKLTDKIIVTSSQRQALELLSDGLYDAALMGNFQGAYLIKKYNIKNVVLRSSDIEPQRYAIAVGLNNEELAWLLNMGLYQLKNNGIYDQLYEKWFGVYEEGYIYRKWKPFIYALAILLIIAAFFVFSLRRQVTRTIHRLKKSEGRLSAVTFIAPVGIGILRGENFLEVNQRFCDLVGYKKEELEGQPIHILHYSVEDFKFIHKKITAQIAENGYGSMEARLMKKDGSTLFVIISSTLIKGGNMEGDIAFTLTDITFQKEAVKQIHRVNERLMFQLENSPLAVVELDASNRIISWSVQAENIFGWMADEIIGLPISDFDFIFDDDRAIVENAFKELAGGVKRNVVLNRNRTKNGQLLECEWYNSAVFDEHGKLTSIFCLANNVTELRKAERLIFEERQRLNSIIDAAGVGTWEWNVQTNDIKFNSIYANMLGYSLDDFRDSPYAKWEELMHPDDLEHARQLLNLHFENPEIRYELECRLHHKMGHWITVLDRGKVISRARDGKPLLMVGTHTDISLIKEAEEQINQSEVRLMSMVNLMQKKTTSEQELLDFALNEILELTHSKLGFIYTYDEVRQKITSQAFSTSVMAECKLEDASRCPELAETGIWAEAVRQRKPLILNDFSLAHPLKRGYPDGHLPITNFLTLPVISNNRIVMVAGVANKETDYNQHDVLQLTLLLDSIFRIIDKIKNDAQITKLSVATEQSPASIIITDKNGTIEYVNRRFESVSGYSAEELIGKVVRIFKPGHLPESEYQEIWDTLKRGEIWSGEYSNRRKSGEIYWESVSISPIRDNDGLVTNYVLVSEDVTLDKQLQEELIAAKEKAEENDKLKTSFLNNLSHEVRTPLNAIVGFSEFITDEFLPAEKKRLYADSVIKSSKQLLALMENIITMAIIETGQAKVNISEASINRMLNEVYNQLMVTSAREEVLLRVNSGVPRQNDKVLIDQTKVMQILTNLVGNALKFTPKGVVQFGCDMDGTHLIFKVEDTGIGFPDGDRDTLFQSFRQGGNSLSGIQEGMGLGLSITKSHVDLLGGTISMQSEPGNGTTFVVKIPYKKIAETVTQVAPMVSIPRNKVVLVADDVEVNHMLVVEMLADWKVEVVYARNGKEAVQLVADRPEIDLVLMDLKMPVMDGFKATAEIKKIRPSLPVIAQTAYAFAADKLKATEAGCDDYIAKPINRTELLQMIGKYL